MSPARRLNDRHPFEIYILAFAFCSSLPLVAGLVPVPGSIAEQLPGWPARVWAVGMMLGSGTALVGLAWKRPPYPRVTVTGLLLEQVGLVGVGSSTIVYAAAVALFAGFNGLTAAAIALAFGLACIAQAIKIRRVLGLSRAA